MNDTAILDWIERHITGMKATGSGRFKIVWLDRGKERETIGDDLRDAVRKANGVTAVSPEPNQCPACGDNRTGKGSLIYKSMVFCNDPCFIKWKKSVLDEAQNP